MKTEPKRKSNKQSRKKESMIQMQETGISRGIPLTNASNADSILAGVSSEKRHQLIAEAAYFRAKQRNFAPGCELEDWLAAESEIETKFAIPGTPVLPIKA
jgi:hypothetical protein